MRDAACSIQSARSSGGRATSRLRREHQTGRRNLARRTTYEMAVVVAALIPRAMVLWYWLRFAEMEGVNSRGREMKGYQRRVTGPMV
jgi:uncharacterized protein (DUF2147 family)